MGDTVGVHDEQQVRPRRSLWWWTGVTLVILGAMIAWAGRFTVGYLFTPLTCELGSWVQYTASAVFVLLGTVALLLSVRLLRSKLELAERFVVSVGLALNLFFVAAMLLETLAVVFVDACAKGAIP